MHFRYRVPVEWGINGWKGNGDDCWRYLIHQNQSTFICSKLLFSQTFYINAIWTSHLKS
jgi:hypothetical protein